MELADGLSAEDRQSAYFDRDRLTHPRGSMEDAVAAAHEVARRWGQRFRHVAPTVHVVEDRDGAVLSEVTHPA